MNNNKRYSLLRLLSTHEEEFKTALSRRIHKFKQNIDRVPVAAYEGVLSALDAGFDVDDAKVKTIIYY
jgi:hypothetical protein